MSFEFPDFEIADSDAHGSECRLLHEFFDRTAKRWPDAVAVDVPPGTGRAERQQVTYCALSRLADGIVQLLGPLVNGECLVAILLQRDTALLYAAQLATLKVGAAYTCIDPAFPDERVRDVVQDSECVAVLTDEAGQERLRGLMLESPPVLNLADVFPSIVTGAEMPSPAWLGSASLAYVIYTSGTTGKPKGVLIEHRSVANLVQGDLHEFQLGPGDRVAQGSSAAYDSSVEETWLAFASGATVVVMDDEAARLGPDLIAWLSRESISVFCPPPTLLRATGCEDPSALLPDLKLLYVGGEALPRDVADRWSRGRRLVNGYGPTECTVTSLRGDVVEGGPITIGRPLPGLFAVAMDSLEEVPQGEQGELCLGGVGLARGYWKSPDLTAEKFIAHPRLGRLYRTGDLVHCDNEGNFHYHGRIDSQVKIRGYRIELGGIESFLLKCPGVRSAACRVQDEAGHAVLVAFVVPNDQESPPPVEDLRQYLLSVLPAYSVPSRFGFVSQLPVTVGGKLDRAALPWLDGAVVPAAREVIAPENATQANFLEAFRQVLGLKQPISVDDDFFLDLGGDSLRAAQLVTRMRGAPETAWITVRDIYEARTAEGIASRAPEPHEQSPVEEHNPGVGKRSPLLVTALQTLWLIVSFSLASWAVYFTLFDLLPVTANQVGIVASLLLAPIGAVGALMVYTCIAVGFAVLMKRLLIGRYCPLRAPVWGGFYLRNWIVQQSVRLIPWALLERTEAKNVILRMLGARIGQRVDIHRGVDLQRGGWDLLEIGDDVTIGRDAEIRLVELDAGAVVVGPISIGSGATLETRAGMAGHTVVETGGFLTALSSLTSGACIPAGERWTGIPAKPAGRAPEPADLPPGGRVLSPAKHAFLLVTAKVALLQLLALPLEVLAIIGWFSWGVDHITLTSWVPHFSGGWLPWTVALTVVVVSVPLTLWFAAGLMRLMGTVPTGQVSRWSPAYVRVLLKIGLLEWVGDWLSGTLFWPCWLRCAGMNIGRGCEISTIMEVVPEHLEIGQETFFADGIYLGGPWIHRGVVTLKMTRLGKNTFLGNHVVVPAGQQLPDDILLGVCVVADDSIVRTGTSWFGLPAFELPRRQVVELDRSLTHEPSRIRYWNRVFWEALRFTLPITPILVAVGWLLALREYPVAAVPLISFAAAALPCILIIALKWALLGRVRPGQHALWSCWCSRWDFLYVAWGQYAAPALTGLEGTLLLPWYLRAMGMKIGRRVVLGGGFSQVVDPDMLHLEDDTTVNAMFQAHTFEDRVLKIDHVHVRNGATLSQGVVPLYGTDIGERTVVAPHSVIMKGERLLPTRRYEGAPVSLQSAAPKEIEAGQDS